MAMRPAFYINGEGLVLKKDVEFEWFPGFSKTQKQKCIKSMHKELKENAIEISTKSELLIGRKLSAFNLKINKNFLESTFQASKIFELGGPYLDLLEKTPREVKKDERLKKSGNLIGFKFDNNNYNLNPKTFFYNYLYYFAVKESVEIEDLKELNKYVYFTDIEFNPKKSINTQAEAICLVKLAFEEYGNLPIFTKNGFMKFYKAHMKY